MAGIFVAAVSQDSEMLAADLKPVFRLVAGKGEARANEQWERGKTEKAQHTDLPQMKVLREDGQFKILKRVEVDFGETAPMPTMQCRLRSFGPRRKSAGSQDDVVVRDLVSNPC